MLSHPVLNGLFNKEASDPSKQLTNVRERFSSSNSAVTPEFLLILPPESLIVAEIDAQWLYHDLFLLSHVADVSHIRDTSTFELLNGSQWQVVATDSEIIPGRGFSDTHSKVKIVDSYLWTPGISWLPYNATYLIVEVDGLIIGNEGPKRFGWFSGGKSTPNDNVLLSSTIMAASPKAISPVLTSAPTSAPTSVPTLTPAATLTSATVSNSRIRSNSFGSVPSAKSEDAHAPAIRQRHRNRRRNPASELGRTKAQKDQNMAKVDYSLACLQQDVVSSRELAERFHKTVSAVRSTLIEAGGSYVDTIEYDTSGDPINDTYFETPQAPELQSTSFTLASIYEYAEARLGSHLLKQLETLLQAEAEEVSFFELHKDLKYLDIHQVDIPNFSSLDEAAFERAISEASLILGRLSNAHSSSEMCTIFLSSLQMLANPALGTVSADTLLGLFMLTVLRTSEDAAAVLERDLYYVTNFSFQASDTVTTSANAGRLSYTLMVVESVLLQLRVEHSRLKKLARYNVEMWSAVRGDDRETLERIGKQSPSSLVSRRSGKSALFMAAEDHNAPLLLFLFEKFPEIFTKDFALKDRDIHNQTLLMAAAADDQTAFTILDLIGDVNSYYQSQDLKGRTVAYYLKPSKLLDRIADKLDWTIRDLDCNTPVLFHVKTHYTRGLPTLIQHCENVLDHIDAAGNSLLHFAALHDDIELAKHLLAFPSCMVDWANHQGETALMLATSEEFRSILLQHGADPWIGKLSAIKSPSLRKARVVKGPYIEIDEATGLLNLFKSVLSEEPIIKTPIDFATLSSEFQTVGPTSWLPPLTYSYSERLRDTDFGSRYFYDLSSLESHSLGFWLRQLQGHATFGPMPILESFFVSKSRSTTPSKITDGREVSKDEMKDSIEKLSIEKLTIEGEQQQSTYTNQMPHDDLHIEEPEKVAVFDNAVTEGEKQKSTGGAQVDQNDNNNEISNSISTSSIVNGDNSSKQSNTETCQTELRNDNETLFPLFGRESEASMLAFLNLGTEQLESIQHGLEEFVRHISHIQYLLARECEKATELDYGLEMLAQLSGYNFQIVHSAKVHSSSSHISNNTFDLLAQFAGDLGKRLQSPQRMADQLATMRNKLEADREKLRTLAEVKPRPAWLGNQEQKRNAEIRDLEINITEDRHSIGNLEAEMRATHYSLANELSSFNKVQEEEILHEVQKYSNLQLQKARGTLQKLQFGYGEKI